MPEITPDQAWNAESVEKQTKELEKTQEQPTEQPEVTAEEKPAEKVKEERVVPLGALHEERARRREETAKRQALEARLAALERQQQQERQQEPQKPAPDPAVDPWGAFIHQQQQERQLTQQQLAEIRANQLKQQAEIQQRAQFESFVQEVRAKDAEYAKENPDAHNAIDFLKAGRISEYEAMGMSHTEAVNRMLHDELNLTVWAMQNGENPAKVAHDMALARGYVSSAKKLEMQKEGQQTSLPTGGGRAGGAVSLQALLKMDGAEFAKQTAGSNWEKIARKFG